MSLKNSPSSYEILASSLNLVISSVTIRSSCNQIISSAQQFQTPIPIILCINFKAKSTPLTFFKALIRTVRTFPSISLPLLTIPGIQIHILFEQPPSGNTLPSRRSISANKSFLASHTDQRIVYGKRTQTLLCIFWWTQGFQSWSRSSIVLGNGRSYPSHHKKRVHKSHTC